jgi:multidrug efflux pump subunit AcrB
MKRFNLSAWAVGHPTLILFLMIMLGAAGFFSYQGLGRAEDPFFTVKVVNVSAIWPGATAQEMQTQVADPIEKKLQELPYFEKVQTYSKPSFTAMQVTFKDSTPPKDVPYLFYMLRKKLADVQGQLPAGLLGPTVNDEFSDVDSILYMMTGDGADYAQLKKAAEGMRQRLLKVTGVTKVNLYGAQDERIFVEFSHAKLATLGITPQALFDSLAKQNNVTPAGKDLHTDEDLETELLRLAVRLAADVRAEGLRARTITVKLRDADFRTRQAGRTVRDGVESDRAIYMTARELLATLRSRRRTGARLVGILASQLVPAGQDGAAQLAMFEETAATLETDRDRRLSRAADDVRQRFGRNAVQPGKLLDRGSGA